MEPPDHNPRWRDEAPEPRERPELITAGSRVELSLCRAGTGCKMRSLLTPKLTICFSFDLKVDTVLPVSASLSFFFSKIENTEDIDRHL